MVRVGGDIQIRAAAGFVPLHDAVPVHLVLRWVDVGEVSGRRDFAGVEERVGGDVVVGEKLGFEVLGEVVKGGAGVGEVGIAACVFWGEGVGAQEGEGGAARVEGGVDVEEGVALWYCSARWLAYLEVLRDRGRGRDEDIFVELIGAI